MDDCSTLKRLMKRPELVVHEVVRHLEKTRNFRAFITPTIVLKSVQAKLKKITLRNHTNEELQDALLQAECDGLVYRIHGVRRADSLYLMSREHQQLHGNSFYTIIPFDNCKYFSTSLRNLVLDVLNQYGPCHASEIYRIILLDKHKFLNYGLEYFEKHVLQEILKDPLKSKIKFENGKYSLKEELKKPSSPSLSTKKTVFANTSNIQQTSSKSKENSGYSVLNNPDLVANKNTFRTYRLSANSHRKTRDEHIASLPWELKIPHYIKDDFKGYLNEELYLQLPESEHSDYINQLYSLPNSIESWEHHHVKCYLTALGFPDLGEYFYSFKCKGIDLLLLTREDIINEFNLPFGKAVKLAAYLKRLHETMI